MLRKGLEDYVWQHWQWLSLSGMIMNDLIFLFASLYFIKCLLKMRKEEKCKIPYEVTVWNFASKMCT